MYCKNEQPYAEDAGNNFIESSNCIDTYILLPYSFIHYNGGHTVKRSGNGRKDNDNRFVDDNFHRSYANDHRNYDNDHRSNDNDRTGHNHDGTVHEIVNRRGNDINDETI